MYLNAFPDGAPPRTTLGSSQRSPDLLAKLGQGKERIRRGEEWKRGTKEGEERAIGL